MGNQQGSFLTAIDVGSAKTCALMAEFTDTGLRYRGHGVAESRGSRKGVIVELDKAVAAIQKAVEAAEDIAGAAVEQAIVGIGGVHVRGINSHGGISLGHAPAGDWPRRDQAGGRPRPRHSACRPIAKFCICCRRNSFSTIRPECTIRWA